MNKGVIIRIFALVEEIEKSLSQDKVTGNMTSFLQFRGAVYEIGEILVENPQYMTTKKLDKIKLLKWYRKLKSRKDHFLTKKDNKMVDKILCSEEFINLRKKHEKIRVENLYAETEH